MTIRCSEKTLTASQQCAILLNAIAHHPKAYNASRAERLMKQPMWLPFEVQGSVS